MRTRIRRLGRRLHTAGRLTVLMIVVSLLLLLIAVYGAWRVRGMQIQSEKILSASVNSIRAAVELEMHIQDLRHQLDRFLLMGELNEINSITARRADIELWLHQAEETATTDEQRSQIKLMISGLASFYEKIDEIKVQEASGASSERLARSAESILDREVILPARQYMNIDESLLESSRSDAELQSRRLVWFLVSLGVFCAVSSMIAGFGLARAISQSLFHLRIPLEDVAGKLSEISGQMTVSGRLDLGDMEAALQRISSEVTGVVEQLHARHKEILHANQLATVGRMAASIAHEIRNPLMSMKMLVQSARDQRTGGLTPRDLQILDEEIRRLEVLLTEFLDFARPKQLEKRLEDLSLLAENTIAFLQGQAEARGVFLECEVPSEPVLVDVDPSRIRQVLLNLLLNGIQVTPRGGQVRLSIQIFEGSGDSACELRVRDDGPGIDPELGQRIFEPFYSTKAIGLGLGLPVTQRIIKKHGGEIFLQTGRSRGAEFVVRLPMPS